MSEHVSPLDLDAIERDLADVDAALTRLDNDTYWVDEVTGRVMDVLGRPIDDAVSEETAQRIARQRGCCKVTLEVLEGNTSAQAAYRRAGFEGYQLDPVMGRAMFWQKWLS